MKRSLMHPACASLPGPSPESNCVDSHVHVYDDRFPFVPDALYIPPRCDRGTATQLRAVLDSHGLTHALLVAASPYGGDNGAVLDAIAASEGRYRGIGLVRDIDVADAAIRRLRDGGIVGLRINLAAGSGELTGALGQRIVAICREVGWLLEVHCIEDDLAKARNALLAARVPLVIDHFGRPDAARGLGQKGFQTLLELARHADAYVKLSAPFRCKGARHPYREVDPFIEQTVRAFGLDRCVWGSDWPFVTMTERVDYGPPMTCLRRWFPEADDRARLLWHTPARLFRFAAGDA